MGLDLRIPIGGMFTVVGLVLTVYGLLTTSTPGTYEKSLNVNVNLWWGAAMFVFGLLFLLFGFRKARAAAPVSTSEPEPAVEPVKPGMD